MLWVIWTAGASTSPVYTIATIAGSSSLGDGGPATAAQIGAIQGIAVDLLGNVYLSDTDHQRVRKIDTAGVITTIAGTGIAGYSGDGGPAAAAHSTCRTVWRWTWRVMFSLPTWAITGCGRFRPWARSRPWPAPEWLVRRETAAWR